MLSNNNQMIGCRDMTNKEKFMNYARRRIADKKYRQRKAAQEVIEAHIEGYERCSKGKWKAGQR